MSRGSQLFRRDAPFSERVLEFIGAAVIVLGVPAFFFALFELGTVIGVLGVVLILGALGAGLIALLKPKQTAAGRARRSSRPPLPPRSASRRRQADEQ